MWLLSAFVYLTLALIPVYLIILYVRSTKNPKKRNLPPGPPGYPVLGHPPLLGLEPHKKILDWAPKYGPIIWTRFGSYPTIIISDYKLAKEAFAKTVFSGRPFFKHFLKRSGGTREGIIFTEGRDWRDQRTFTLKTLRGVGGFGTKAMETVIQGQVDELVAELGRKNGAPMKTHGYFNVAILNVLWTLLAGAPFEQSDPEIGRINQLTVEAVAQTNAQTMVCMFVPWLGDWLPNWASKLDGLEKLYQPILDFLKPYVDKHWAERVAILQESDPPAATNFIDAYIDEIHRVSDPSSSFHLNRARYSLSTILLDLFLAGGETTGTTLEWICLMLAAHPEIQDKLAQEIDTHVNMHEALPNLADRPLLPYTEAVIHETMRLRPILPLSVTHSTMEDTELGGYEIPKDTMVFINVYEAHFNAQLWDGDPEVFRPERWIRDGEFVKRDGFLNFSTGKRVCLGEQLARDELFLLVTELVHNFKIEFGNDINSDAGKPSLEPKLGGTSSGPQEHFLAFKKRQPSEE